jgi:hypothetical protein
MLDWSTLETSPVHRSPPGSDRATRRLWQRFRMTIRREAANHSP